MKFLIISIYMKFLHILNIYILENIDEILSGDFITELEEIIKVN